MLREDHMPDVIIYTADYCPYCKAAKEFLKSKGVSYQEIDVTHDQEKRLDIAQRSGQKTVPQIFINGKSMGGYSDLKALDEKGELDKILTKLP